MRIHLFAAPRPAATGAERASAPAPAGVIQLDPQESELAEAAAFAVARQLVLCGTAPAIEVVRHAQTVRYFFPGEAGELCEVTPLGAFHGGVLPLDLTQLVAGAIWIERVAFTRRRLRRGPHQGWWCAAVRSAIPIADCVAAARQLGYADAGPRVPSSVWLRRATPSEWLEQR